MARKRNEKEPFNRWGLWRRLVFDTNTKKSRIHFIQSLIRIKYPAPKVVPYCVLIPKAIFHIVISAYVFFFLVGIIKISTGACFVCEKWDVVDLLCQKEWLKRTRVILSSNLRWNADYDAWLDSFLIPQIYCFKSTALSHDSIIQSILQGLTFRRKNIWRYENLVWPIYFDLGKQLYLIPNVCRGQGSYITLQGCVRMCDRCCESGGIKRGKLASIMSRRHQPDVKETDTQAAVHVTPPFLKTIYIYTYFHRITSQKLSFPLQINDF